MKLIEGRKIADKILREISGGIGAERLTPGLGVVLVGNDQASKIYVNLKEKAARDVGVNFFKSEFDSDENEKNILKKIEEFNADEKVHGIIVQLPLPKKFDTQKIIESIDPKKDADGFCPKNIEKFIGGDGEIFPVFPGAIVMMIESTGVNLENKKAVVISNSDIFGEIMIEALRREGIKGEYVLAKGLKKFENKELGIKNQKENSIENLKEADIVITACGIPKIIKSEMIKDGAIVIDGGITKIDGRIVGDVDFELAKNRDIFLSPVPGGVGPVTVAMLIKNVWNLANNQN
ncbi:MAG: Bifunctional protein FolD [Candidatus Moranbacteria bacterium GW2011_GWE2_35_2-]|nr:MAG: Bifunctional protein FolD [Candidatus Moranbacteria bacterium GW2011_GWE2_35_2-]KKQ06299.1 MAG: Bifunctional protein FolD [Candidatus Moranbacteria bacterium GW2011_GWF1_36_4]KKQ22297.1 MAG: Bifunctional protein FolD [Candidatus Moranbacteria bacterium GW2011_GWF2_37_11]KKQ28525.1 MAG: Bifunctional protein FolD [Candidatus Moranbacteria bacterium GW2011_GWD1_37_17]KKQ30211.1 MAG: Bifunctional protein FolD [Candidatus Moranbacteria bacterium GW2011_GWE1_37_24]KKQ47641.1 MAG: Bifunctiona